MSLSAALLSRPAASESTGGRLVAVDGRVLPLRGASLVADAKAGVIRVTLTQTFANPHAEPMSVTYSLALPADGAVSGFAFRVGDRRVVGEVDTRLKARQRFEDAVLEGKTAALLDQERTSLFTQEVGNVPPRTEVVCETIIDQKLAWLPDGCWEWRFPTVVAPRYLGESGRVADAARVTMDVADRALPVKLSLGLSVRDRLFADARPYSPSHPLHTEAGLGRVDVAFAEEGGAGLDRDVVVRWRAADVTVGASLDVGRSYRDAIAGSAFGLITLVPPVPEAGMTPLPRDLIVLLDTSGSMSGAPLDQARRVTSALVDSLRDDDQLELIEFSNSPRRWKSGPVKATAANRKAAQAWLSKLRASGGTEMRSGILEALAPLRDGAQRQVVLVTDGLIGSEHEVLDAIAKRLPRGSRVHTVGVGSAVNRSLTQPAARAGRGVELLLGLGEDAEVAVKRILARTAQPLVTEVEVTGTAVQAVAPKQPQDLFAGAPALVGLRLDPRGGTIVLRGRTADGPFEQRLELKPVERGEGSAVVATLFGREHVEDVELARSVGFDPSEADREVERTGLDFQISTRLTSWIAVSEEATVDPRAPKRKETMPQQLPFGLSAEGVGLREVSLPTATGGGAGLMASLGGAFAAAAAPTTGSFAAYVPSPAAPGSPPPQRLRRQEAEKDAKELKADTSAPVFQSTSIADSGPASDDEGAPASKEERAGASRRASVDRLSESPGAPRGAPPPAKKGLGSLVDLVRDAFAPKAAESAGELAPPDTAKAKAPAPSEPSGPVDRPSPKPAQRAPTPTRRVQGKLVSLRDGRLVVELTFDGETTWSPGTEASLHFADGSMLKVKVAEALSTAAGWYGAGLSLTLVLEVPSGLAAPATLELHNGAELVVISL